MTTPVTNPAARVAHLRTSACTGRPIVVDVGTATAPVAAFTLPTTRNGRFPLSAHGCLVRPSRDF